MEIKKSYVTNADGHKLAVYLMPNISNSVILMCPGIIPNHQVQHIEKAYKLLYSTGNSICYFDRAGQGESEGIKAVIFERDVRDISRILFFLKKKYQQVLLYAPSVAGGIGIAATLRYKDINKLILVNGFFYFHKWLTFRQFLRFVLYVALHPVAFDNFFFEWKYVHPEKITIPTLVVYGENDTIVSPKQSMGVYNELQTKNELLMIPKAGHNLGNDEYIPHLKRLFDWVTPNDK